MSPKGKMPCHKCGRMVHVIMRDVTTADGGFYKELCWLCYEDAQLPTIQIVRKPGRARLARVVRVRRNRPE